jgi:hypothetical protein
VDALVHSTPERAPEDVWLAVAPFSCLGHSSASHRTLTVPRGEPREDLKPGLLDGFKGVLVY